MKSYEIINILFYNSKCMVLTKYLKVNTKLLMISPALLWLKHVYVSPKCNEQCDADDFKVLVILTTLSMLNDVPFQANGTCIVHNRDPIYLAYIRSWNRKRDRCVCRVEFQQNLAR